MPTHLHEIEPELKIALQALNNLISEVYTSLDGIKIPASKISLRTEYALGTLTSSIGGAEAVHTLVANHLSIEAMKNLRGMVDGHINLCFNLQIDGDERWIRSRASEGKIAATRVQKMINACSNDKFGSIPKSVLVRIKQDLEEQIAAADQLLRSRGLASIGSVKVGDLSEKVDSYEKMRLDRNEPDQNIRFLYLMVYGYLSAESHASTNLTRYITASPTSIDLNPLEAHTDAHMVVMTAYSVLADTYLATRHEIGLDVVGMAKRYKAEIGKMLPNLE